MSFESEYIEKYGQRAVEAYKRSLRHSDVKEKSEKSLTQRNQLRRSNSCSKNQMHGKSGQGSYIKKAGKQGLGCERGKGQVSSLQLVIHPNKKKLVISDLSTPKETPSKTLPSKKGQKMMGTTTNVNVFVNAMNRSKSKESTPCRDKHKTKRYKNTPTSL
jgi:hypothetical protein